MKGMQMKIDKRRLDRRWTDKIHSFDFGLLFAFGIAVGVGASVLYSFLR